MSLQMCSSYHFWLMFVQDLRKNLSVGLCAPTICFAHCYAVFSIPESLWFHCAQKVFGYKRAEYSMVSRVMHRIFHPHWVSSESWWEFFTFHFFCLCNGAGCIKDQVVSRKRTYQERVLDIFAATQDSSYATPYLLVLQPVSNAQGHSAQPSAKAQNLSSSLLPHL